MARQPNTMEGVEKEISKLKESPYVKLARLEQRLKQDKRRKELAQLRWLEKRGKALFDLGIDADSMAEFVEAADD